ncbi:MAG: hypothetical protein JWR35_3925 [Marmoricola sp.]|nr:hypothetical protein [Marmoricola sp.]
MSDVIWGGVFGVLIALIGGFFGLEGTSRRRLSLLQQEMAALKELPENLAHVRQSLEESLDTNWRSYLLLRHPVGRLERKQRRLVRAGTALAYSAPLVLAAGTFVATQQNDGLLIASVVLIAVSLCGILFSCGALLVKASLVRKATED